MKSRLGAKSGSFCLSSSNSKAPPIAFAVHEPSCPWSYTAGICGRRSTRGGSASAVRRGTRKEKSRWSGRSGTQPYRLIVILRGIAICCLLYTSDAADEEDSVDLGGRRII